MRHAEFNHPVLVQVYDAMFGWSRDDDFFMSVVGATPDARVLDLGCGTGRLALAMSAAGHTVTGVDPAKASLDAARAKPGAERVTWIEGSTDVLPEGAFDLAVMTSHVAQFFVTDEQWKQALSDLKRALAPGGRLTFDSRDPRARGWKQWNPADSRRQVCLPDGRRVTATIDVDAVTDDVVSFTIRYSFSDGQSLASTGDLRFRTESELRSSLEAAGFAIEEIYGGWNREPIGASDGEFLVIALA
ncbi:MAG: class I SAM-dependent methyltransferase [Nocardiopsaceae bacterium]|jgi:ubiquinone/menaquinone biosynthesis C-methylase UbiE|nr:class I SAM-dependent methyltransferase [Nocardiopsaceae bacterium]